MFALAIGLMLADVPGSATKLAAVCEVGSAAIADLPNINFDKASDAYYAAPDSNGRDLLTICPALKASLPKGYPVADEDARSRAAIHAPIFGRNVREAFIYSVGIPELSEDLKSATVHFSYSCTGLCGAELEARYVRGPKGWRRDGPIRLLSVS